MEKCDRIFALLERRLDGELEASLVQSVDAHVASCPRCAKRWELLQKESKMLRQALALSDEEPAGLAEQVWAQLGRPPAPVRWARFAWAGTAVVAAAAMVMIALFTGILSHGGGPGAELARVETSSGQIEVYADGKWAPLGAWSVLRDGDRVRAGKDFAGAMILEGKLRVDLDSGAEVAMRMEDSHLALELTRGRVHVDSGEAGAPAVRTPVAQVAADAARPAEFELALQEQSTAFHLLPAAYAETAAADLEVSVYAGSLKVTTPDGEAATVGAGQMLAVDAGRAMGPAVAMAPDARTPWWPLAETRFAQAVKAEPKAPLPSVLEAALPDPFKPEPKDVAASSAKDLPPAPRDVAARPDVNAVLVSWTSLTGTKTPIVAYNVYRRGLMDSEFSLASQFPASGSRQADICIFLDHVTPGTEYEYRVAAVWQAADGRAAEGPTSATVTGRAADFTIRYIGVNGNHAAAIIVEKLYDGQFRQQTFAVNPRDLATAEPGQIGQPRSLLISATPPEARKEEVVDFSTGYHLVAMNPASGSGATRKPALITIENDLGMRRQVEQEIE